MLAPRQIVASKLCVDFAPTTSASSSSSCAISVRQKKQIEDVLDKLLESLNKRTITVQAANGMAQRAQTLLEDLPSNPGQVTLSFLCLVTYESYCGSFVQCALLRCLRSDYPSR